MYTSLVIAGGAMKALSVIGIIKYLEEKDLIKYIRTFVGTSAGAVMTLLLALGYTHKDIYKLSLQILEDESVTTFNVENILDIFATYGMSSGENLEILFNRIITQKYHINDMNFIDFTKASGKNLVICVSNLTKETHEYFSVDTTPNMSVAKAIKISCSIPLMYSPVTLNDNIYLDGGLYNNFPIDYFSDHVLKDILGINIRTTNYQKSDNFLNYVRFILNSLAEKFNTKSINIKDRNVITLEFEDDDSWFSLSEIKISLTKEKLEKYISQGYNKAKESLIST
jgi:predicted acylesterase/phospholipase RssA